MRYYECDWCNKKNAGSAEVILKGATGTSGIETLGALLPERYHEKGFCSTDCFWKWTEKYSPLKNVDKK